MITPRSLLEAALTAARTTQASAGMTITLIESQLASLDQDAIAGGKVYSLTEAAERRNLSPHTLRSWIRSGKLQCRRGPRGAFLVTDADLDAALGAPKAEPVVHTELPPVEHDHAVAQIAGYRRRVR